VNQEDSEQNEVDGMKKGADVDNIGQPNRQSALTVWPIIDSTSSHSISQFLSKSLKIYKRAVYHACEVMVE